MLGWSASCCEAYKKLNSLSVTEATKDSYVTDDQLNKGKLEEGISLACIDALDCVCAYVPLHATYS